MMLTVIARFEAWLPVEVSVADEDAPAILASGALDDDVQRQVVRAVENSGASGVYIHSMEVEGV